MLIFLVSELFRINCFGKFVVIINVDFESNFVFETHLPPPDHFVPSPKSYPSKNLRNTGNTGYSKSRYCCLIVFYIFYIEQIMNK